MEKTCTVRLTFSKTERDEFKRCRKAYGWSPIKEKSFIEINFNNLIQLVKSFRQVHRSWVLYMLNKGVRQVRIVKAPEDWRKQLEEARSTLSLPVTHLELLRNNIDLDEKIPVKGIFHTFDELGYPSAYGIEQRPLPKEPKIQSPTSPAPEPSSNNTDGFKIWDMKRIWPLDSVVSEIADWRKIDEMIKSAMSNAKQTQDKLSQEQKDKDLFAKMEAEIANINAAAVVSGLALLQNETINEENLRKIFSDNTKIELLMGYLFPNDPPWPLIDTIDLGFLGIHRTFDDPSGIKQYVIYTWNEICERAKYNIAQIKASTWNEICERAKYSTAQIKASKDTSGAIPSNIRDISKKLELRCANASTNERKRAHIVKPQQDPVAEKTPNLHRYGDQYVTRPTESTIKGFEQDFKNLQKFIDMCSDILLSAYKEKQEEKQSPKPAQAQQSAETKTTSFTVDWEKLQLIYPDGKKVRIQHSCPGGTFINWTEIPADKQEIYQSDFSDLFELTMFHISVVAMPRHIQRRLFLKASTIFEGVRNFKSL